MDILSYNWQILRTKDNYNIINNWFTKNGYGMPSAPKWYISIYNDRKYDSTTNPKPGYIVLSFEEFNDRIISEDPKPNAYKYSWDSHRKIEVIDSEKINKLHIDFKSPIVMIDKHTNVTINPKLDNFNFGKKYDANQAHQKIS